MSLINSLIDRLDRLIVWFIMNSLGHNTCVVESHTNISVSFLSLQ